MSRFRLLKQGYDRFEVDRVIDEYETQIAQNQQKLETYQSQLSLSQKQLESLKERYQQLQDQLIAKENAASQVHQMALKEANAIIENAQQNADIIVAEALGSARLILMELSKITTQTNQVKLDLKQQIESLNHMIDEVVLPDIPNIDWLTQNKTQQSEE